MKKNKNIFAILPLICLVSGCGLLPVEKEIMPMPTVKEFVKEEVKSVAVARGTLIQDETLSGIFLASKKQDCFFEQADMVIQNVYVEKGTYVEAGQLLIDTVNTDIIKSIEDQEFKVAQMELNLKHTKERQELSLKAEQEKLTYYTKQYNNALYMEEQFGNEHYVYTIKDLENLKTNVDNQQKAIDKLLVEQKRVLEDTEDDLNNERIKLDDLNIKLEKTMLKAEINGVVTYIKTIADGDKTVALEKMVTILDQSQSLFRLIGDAAKKFSLGDTTQVTFKSVNYNATVIDPTGLIKESELIKGATYMKVENLPEDLKDGASGTIYRIIDKVENVLYIAKNLVNTADGESFVYVYVDDVKQKKVVKTGFEGAKVIEIVSGLEEGELVAK